ncbi:50S ribosomal protein L32 [Candidatus Hodgkinia cicadicola]|nr:50S ribosomal protein L32 [Candidatus Hodgkinia cicadicola]
MLIIVYAYYHVPSLWQHPKVSLNRRGSKRKRVFWHGLAAGARCHHVMLWKYKTERSVSIGD